MLAKRNWFVTVVLSMMILYSPFVLGRTYGSSLCQYAGFYCLKVHRGQSWYSLFPDTHDRDIVMRINRMNTHIYTGMVIAVPENLANSEIIDYSPFSRMIPAPQEKIIIIDPMVQAWAAYDSSGILIKWGPASSGAEYCNDIDEACQTHEGSFRVFSMGSSDCYSTKFPLPDGGAPMPYCMYFNDGQALHGEPNGLPGYNVSHGCVRLFVNDAEWLRYDFAEAPNFANRYRGTKVIVKSYTETS